MVGLHTFMADCGCEPPRQAEPATLTGGHISPPLQGGEWSDTMHCADTVATTPSGFACHPSTGGEWSDTMHCADTVATTPWKGFTFCTMYQDSAQCDAD